MKLKQASIGIRKAAYLQGVSDREAEWEPIFDPTDGPDKKLATVSTDGKVITITSGDLSVADAQTWNEIRRNS